MYIVEYVFLLHAWVSSGYIPRSRIVGSSGSIMPCFLRSYQIDFQNGSNSLQPHQQQRSVSLSQHPLQHLLSPEFLILAILTGVRWNLMVVLIRISSMFKEAKHFFRCFSSMKYSPIENSLFNTVPHF